MPGPSFELKYAQCDICHRSIATMHEVFVAYDYDTEKWQLECDSDSPEHDRPGTYPIKASELLAGGTGTMHWLRQLEEKTWFNPADFFKCVWKLQ